MQLGPQHCLDQTCYSNRTSDSAEEYYKPPPAWHTLCTETMVFSTDPQTPCKSCAYTLGRQRQHLTTVGAADVKVHRDRKLLAVVLVCGRGNHLKELLRRQLPQTPDASAHAHEAPHGPLAEKKETPNG